MNGKLKWGWILAILLLALACTLSGPGKGAPSRITISGAKGLFLQNSGKAMNLLRTLQSRAVISATAGTLGAITTAGIPEIATFTDDMGATVDVTVTKALQLTSTFVLLSYTYAGGSKTGILDMTSGNLASLSQVPDNWANIYSRGTSAWYVSAGSIWRTDLTTGAVAELSSGSTTWDTDRATVSGYAAWSWSTWIYADVAGNAYAIYAENSASMMALCMKADGGAVDFGDEPAAWVFFNAIQKIPTGRAWVNHVAVDLASGLCYLLRGQDIWDGDPLAVGGTTITGMALKAYAVTFDPEDPAVLGVATYPTAASVMTLYLAPTTYVGFASALDSSIWSNGTDTFRGAVSAGQIALEHFDTSTVPAMGGENVANWKWSGGHVYAGPASEQKIGIIKFSGGSGTCTTLVNDSSTISAWDVVGGVLFYTDDTGTYQATVDAEAATISTPQIYAGGPIQAITQ